MQVIPTTTDGLRREFRVVVPAQDLAQRLAGELEGLRAKARAFVWCRAGDLSELGVGDTTDVMVQDSILRDLLAGSVAA